MIAQQHDSQASISTVSDGADGGRSPAPSLDFAPLGRVFVLPTHLSTERLREIERILTRGNGVVTYDVREADVVLGNLTQKRRAALELRARGLYTADAADVNSNKRRSPSKRKSEEISDRAKKRRTLDAQDVSGKSTSPIVIDDNTQSDGEHLLQPSSPKEEAHMSQSMASISLDGAADIKPDKSIAKVYSITWLDESLSRGELQPLQDYSIYSGFIIPKPKDTPPAPPETQQSPTTTILTRALADAETNPPSKHRPKAPPYLSTTKPHTKHPSLPRTSTTENSSAEDLPTMPTWVQKKSTYSCERSTPVDGPNEAFVVELKKIRTARELIADAIGVRAYSTAIASVAAYPRRITMRREVLALPGCDTKIASLWREFRDTGSVRAAREAEGDEKMRGLKTFYDIWGVGATSAREFWNRGWRSLDDVVAFGWGELSRTQQIGVKYYDEFLMKIPRAEVERIAETVAEAARRVREPEGVRTVIVGGYRRGKEESGDVDMIVSHLDEQATVGIVRDIVDALEDTGWITHELITTTQNSKREQDGLPMRPQGGGHGMDHLDKSMLVWQDPEWPGKDEAMARLGDPVKVAKENPNPHRRLDVIIAPWSRVGCAVLGWSSGTTFQRDVRRYAKYVKRWKFDSSGIRDRSTNRIVDLESIGGRPTDAVEAERKVFAGLGLVYREPWERCTG